MSTQDRIQDLLIGAQDLLLLGAVVAAIVLAFITRDDVREAREARYDQSRPILVPVGSEFFLMADTVRGLANYPYADLARDSIHATVSNIGTGPALSVVGVIFGPQPELPDEDQGHHSFRFWAPIKNGDLEWETTERGGLRVYGDLEIRSRSGKPYTLYAPPRPPTRTDSDGIVSYVTDGVSPIIVARLTLTYHDVFGRKHATIYHYTSEQQWRPVGEGFFPDIKRDLEDLEREHAASRRTQMEPVLDVPPQYQA